jgi:hypothetical protein
MLISTALLLNSNIRNSVCTPAKLPCRRVEVGCDMMYYTGFPNHDIFKTTLNLLFEYGNNNINVKMNYNVGGSRPKQRML